MIGSLNQMDISVSLYQYIYRELGLMSKILIVKQIHCMTLKIMEYNEQVYKDHLYDTFVSLFKLENLSPY